MASLVLERIEGVRDRSDPQSALFLEQNLTAACSPVPTRIAKSRASTSCPRDRALLFERVVQDLIRGRVATLGDAPVLPQRLERSPSAALNALLQARLALGGIVPAPSIDPLGHPASSASGVHRGVGAGSRRRDPRPPCGCCAPSVRRGRAHDLSG